MIDWQDPPKERRPYKRERYKDCVRALMGAPGRWGRLDTFQNAQKANSARTNLKYALIYKRYKFPEGHDGFVFDFSVMKDEDKETPEWGLYGRARKIPVIKKEEDND